MIEPCPFCGASEANGDAGPHLATPSGEPPSGQSSPDRAIRCGSCGAMGGWAHTEDGARRLWAMRAPRQSPC